MVFIEERIGELRRLVTERDCVLRCGHTEGTGVAITVPEDYPFLGEMTPAQRAYFEEHAEYAFAKHARTQECQECDPTSAKLACLIEQSLR